MPAGLMINNSTPDSLQNKLSFDSLIPSLFLLSFAFYSLSGFDTALVDDASVLMFVGQGLAQGLVPYQDSFVIKGPLSSFLVAFGIKIGEWSGMPEIQSARLMFSLFASFSATSVYVLGRDMFRCRWVGLLSFLTLLSFFAYLHYISAGPRAKIPIVLFESLCLLNILHRRWFWVGLFSSLALLTWQPTGLFCIAGLIFAFFSEQDRKKGLKSVVKLLYGSFLPILLFLSYFFLKDALKSFLDGFLLIHVSGVNNRAAISFQGLERFFIKHLGSNGFVAVAYVFSFIYFSTRQWARYKGRETIETFWQDPYSPLFVTLLAFTCWTLVDYQGIPDSFPFLPHLSISFALLVRQVVNFIEKYLHLWPNIDSFKVLMVMSVAGLALFGSYPALQKNLREIQRKLTLNEQMEYDHNFIQHYGKDLRVMCMGKKMAPCIFFRIHSPNRYHFIDSGIDLYMEQMEPGGFDGWFKRIREYDPQIVFFTKASGKRMKIFKSWLSNNFKRVPGKPRGTIYLKRIK